MNFPGNVFATANVIGGRQVLCWYEGKVDIDVHRVTVQSYDSALAVHMHVSFDFEDADKAWHFFSEYKRDPQIAAQIAESLQQGFTVFSEHSPDSV